MSASRRALRGAAVVVLGLVISLVPRVGAGAAPSAAPPGVTSVILTAADGTRVYGRRFGRWNGRRPAIVLFHQAQSNAHEYDTIAPRLVALGFDALAIDQRSGGAFYPPGNRTVDARGSSDPRFVDALPDLEAALAYAVARRGAAHAPIVVWGSSYSAALVFALAAKHPHDVAALVAFSPGEYIEGDPAFVHRAAKSLAIPVFVDSAADAGEEAAAASIVAQIAKPPAVHVVPHHGIHGSSTLVTERDPDGASENWDAVTRFLRAFASR